jgi:predicted ArsR family transcriptional regulator
MRERPLARGREDPALPPSEVPTAPPDRRESPDAIASIGLLAEPTRRRLYDAVAGRHGGEIGRDEAAAALGISRELAAFHLDRLVAGGLLETAYRRPAGRRGGPGAGRPAKLYRRAAHEIGVSLPDRRYEDVAEMLAEGLERLETSVGTGTVIDAVGEVARARGRETGTQVRRELGGRPGRARLRQALVSLVERLGYEPEAASASEGTGGEVVLCNCPYRPIADAHRDITCGMNMAWAEGVAEGLGDDGITARFTQTPGRCCVTFATESR